MPSLIYKSRPRITSAVQMRLVILASGRRLTRTGVVNGSNLDSGCRLTRTGVVIGSNLDHLDSERKLTMTGLVGDRNVWHQQGFRWVLSVVLLGKYASGGIFSHWLEIAQLNRTQTLHSRQLLTCATMFQASVRFLFYSVWLLPELLLASVHLRSSYASNFWRRIGQPVAANVWCEQESIKLEPYSAASS